MKKTLYTLILAILGLSIIPISPLEAQIELSATFQKDYVRQEKRKLKKKVREINDLVDEGKISENEAQKMIMMLCWWLSQSVILHSILYLQCHKYCISPVKLPKDELCTRLSWNVSFT